MFIPLVKHSNHSKGTLKMDTCASVTVFNIQSSDGATTMAKVSLYSTFTKSTVSFGYV